MVLFQVYELIIRVVAKAAPRARARVRVECLVDFVRRRSPKQNKNKQEGGKKKRYSVWMLLRWARPALVRASHIFLSFVSPCQLPCGINRYGMEWVDFLRLLFFAPRFFCVFSQCFFWGGFSCFVFCFSFWLFGFLFRAANCGGGGRHNNNTRKVNTCNDEMRLYFLWSPSSIHTTYV